MIDEITNLLINKRITIIIIICKFIRSLVLFSFWKGAIQNNRFPLHSSPLQKNNYCLKTKNKSIKNHHTLLTYGGMIAEWLALLPFGNKLLSGISVVSLHSHSFTRHRTRVQSYMSLTLRAHLVAMVIDLVLSIGEVGVHNFIVCDRLCNNKKYLDLLPIYLAVVWLPSGIHISVLSDAERMAGVCNIAMAGKILPKHTVKWLRVLAYKLKITTGPHT